MPKPKGGLGRGLGSLIPQNPVTREEPGAPSGVAPAVQSQQLPDRSAAEETAPRRDADSAASLGLAMLSVNSISPNPQQPRQVISEEQLDELASSIREHGLLQPLLVTRGDKKEGYSLIAGERRWRAAMMAGLHSVPAIIKEASTREMLEMALVENLQRADLNPLEEASAYRSLVEEFGLKQDEVAAKVGKSRGAVANSLRLLKLPAAVQESLALGLISEGHARAILQVPGEAMQLRLLERTVADGLSVRQVEALARRLAESAGSPEEPAEKEKPLYDEMRDIEDRFRSALGTKVQLSQSSRGGKLVIYFYSNEELERIYGTIVGDEK